MQKACTESCAIPVPCDSADKAACATVTKLFTADQWSVTVVTLPPGAKYAQHTHLANFLNVPLADADVTVKNQDQPETVVHYKTGEVTWNNPVVHAVTNNGKTTAKLWSWNSAAVLREKDRNPWARKMPPNRTITITRNSGRRA